MIGRVLAGRYRIESLIGKGGMAIVYRAEDLRTHRIVAVKVLREEYSADEEFLRRFDREAQVYAKTSSHPNIVSMLDLGADGRVHFLVMEYVNGKTLKEIIREYGKLRPDWAVHLTLQILAALSHAHQQHVIHRDIKPQNMLLDENGRIKVGDFGIAKMTDSATMTIADGNVMGSVHYFSPEQAKGLPVSATSDLYSVGVMLYEMLCGHVPFDGDTPVSVAMKHLTELPKPISQEANVSPALEQVLAKALCKQADQRYQTAEAMARDLRRAMRHPEGGFVNMRPAEGDEQQTRRHHRMKRQLRQSMRRRKLLTAFLTLLLSLTLLTGLGYTAMVIYDRTFRHVSMPDVMGLDEANAVDILGRAGVMPIVSRRYSESPSGTVLEQTPDSGTSVPRGESVYITVSNGTDILIVPNLMGMTAEEAEYAVGQAGLSVGDVTVGISEAMIGTVFAQDPPADTVAGRDTVVDIRVSGGLVIIPDLTGRRLEESETELQGLGLSVGSVTLQAVDNAAQDGTVLTQNPGKFERVFPQTAVDLVVGQFDNRKYSATVAISVTVPQDGAHVRVTLVEPGGAEVEQYAAMLTQPGENAFSIELRSEYEGRMAYRLYIDERFISETEVTLR